MTTPRVPHPPLDAPTSDWLVYGDALQEVGDPRGELVGLSHAIDEGRADAATREAYVRTHAAALLGPAAKYLDRLAIDFRYADARAIRVTIQPLDHVTGILDAVMAAPIATQLRGLAIAADPLGDRGISLAEGITELCARHGERLRELALIDARAERSRMLVSRDFEPAANLVQLGSLAPLWRLPNLEALRLVVADAYQVELGDLDAPALRRFELHDLRLVDGWSDDEAPILEQLARAKWPRLERFALALTETYMANTPDEVEPYISYYGADVTDDEGEPRYPEVDPGEVETFDWAVLRDLLVNLRDTTALRELALTTFVNGASLVATLAEVGVAPTLTTLELSDSELGDADVAALVASGRFAHLARIAVERTHVTEAAARKLPGAVAWSAGDGARFRYVVGAE